MNIKQVKQINQKRLGIIKKNHNKVNRFKVIEEAFSIQLSALSQSFVLYAFY